MKLIDEMACQIHPDCSHLTLDAGKDEVLSFLNPNFSQVVS